MTVTVEGNTGYMYFIPYLSFFFFGGGGDPRLGVFIRDFPPKQELHAGVFINKRSHTCCSNSIYNVTIIILIFHLTVRDVRADGHGKPFDPSQNVFFPCITGLGCYITQPTDTAYNETSRKLK